MASNEIQIQSAICEYLALREKQGKLLYWRQNNIQPSGVRNGKVFFYKTNNHSKKGIPDIIVIKDGFFIGLEVKDKTKQSPDQKEFERILKENGGEYHVVRSIDEVQELGL